MLSILTDSPAMMPVGKSKLVIAIKLIALEFFFIYINLYRKLLFIGGIL
jgi:hypothetical protein